MTVIKRSSLAFVSVALMLTIVGYINYRYNPEREQNLGQTVYVNGKDSFTYENVSIYDEESLSANNIPTQTKIVKEDDSISVFRYDRDNMYSELSENYSNIVSNSNSSKEQVVEYQKKLDKLIQEKNLITMVENVIKTKGIDDIVIIPTSNENINVVLKSKEEISDEKMAQIQQIVVDQLGVNANKLSITVKQ